MERCSTSAGSLETSAFESLRAGTNSGAGSSGSKVEKLEHVLRIVSGCGADSLAGLTGNSSVHTCSAGTCDCVSAGGFDRHTVDRSLQVFERLPFDSQM